MRELFRYFRPAILLIAVLMLILVFDAKSAQAGCGRVAARREAKQEQRAQAQQANAACAAVAKTAARPGLLCKIVPRLCR